MNLFDDIQLLLQRAEPREIVSVAINTWLDSGIQIAGFTHVDPLANLEQWARHHNLYFRVAVESGYIQLAKS